MTQNELRNQELGRHEEKVDRNIERHENLNLEEKQRGIQAANQNSSVARIINIVNYLFGAVEVVLLLRFVLHLIGANADNGFANFIYLLSSPFVVLFQNLVQNPALSATSTLEITTIIAIIVWAIVAWLVGRLMWLVMSRPR